MSDDNVVEMRIERERRVAAPAHVECFISFSRGLYQTFFEMPQIRLDCQPGETIPQPQEAGGFNRPSI